MEVYVIIPDSIVINGIDTYKRSLVTTVELR